MCKRYFIDCLISLIGSYFLLFSTLGLFHFSCIVFEFFHQKKYSVGSSFFKIFREMLYEFTWSYWYSC